MFNRYILLAVLLVSLFFSSLSLVSAPIGQEANIELDTIGDSYIAEDSPELKAGKEDYLVIGYMEHTYRKNCYIKLLPRTKEIWCEVGASVKNKRNILVHFDLSDIPPGAVITEAVLQLHSYFPQNSIPITVYGLTECFSEDSVTWNEKEAGFTWKTFGGTHELGFLQKGTLGTFEKDRGYYRFDVTDYYARVFKGEIENCGILIATEPNNPPLPDDKIPYRAQNPKSEEFDDKKEYYAQFHSKDWAQREGKLEYAPKLFVTFIKPSVTLSSDLGMEGISLMGGETKTFLIEINGTFLGEVGLEFEFLGGNPEGIHISMGKAVGKPRFTVPINITADEDAPPGKYTIFFRPVVEGFDPSYIDLGSLNLTIDLMEKEKPYKDFLVMPDVAKVSLAQGGSVDFRVNLVPRGKFWAKVGLSADAPDWLSVEFSPEEGVPSFASHVTLRASPTAPLGEHELRIIASGGEITKEFTIKVEVKPGTTTTQQQTTSESTTITSPSQRLTTTPQPTTTRTTTTTETITPEAGGISPLYLLIPLLVALAVGLWWKYGRR